MAAARPDEALAALQAEAEQLWQVPAWAQRLRLPSPLRRALARPHPAALLRVGELVEAAYRARPVSPQHIAAVQQWARRAVEPPAGTPLRRATRAALTAALSRIADGERQALTQFERRLAVGSPLARTLARAHLRQMAAGATSAVVRARAAAAVGDALATTAEATTAAATAAAAGRPILAVKDSVRRHRLMPAPAAPPLRAALARLGVLLPSPSPRPRAALLYTPEGTYVMGHTLVAGAFGKFRVARDPDGVLVGIKELRTAPARRRYPKTHVSPPEQIQDELAIMREVGSPLYTGRHFVDGAKRYVVTPLYAGTLEGLVRQPRSKARRHPAERRAVALATMGPLASEVAALHARRLVHRDIKPDNVLFGADGRVVLADYGITARLAAGADVVPGRAGTPRFMAPEAYLDERSSAASDVYALGLTFVHLVASSPLMAMSEPTAEAIVAVRELFAALPRTPAGGIDLARARLFDAGGTRALNLAPLRALPAPVLDFLFAKMLAPDPAARPTAREVATFFTTGAGAPTAAERAATEQMAAEHAPLPEPWRAATAAIDALAPRRGITGW